MSVRKSPGMAAFGHLKVIELASILAGPAVGQFFAELGADVLKVERPEGGDPTRGWRLKGEESPDGMSAYFCAVNWGKRSVTLDLKTQSAQLDGLLEGADVLLVNFRPGSGLALESLRARFPRLVIGSVTGYGPDHPRPGFDALIQAESGFMDLNGLPGGPAARLPVALLDLMTAHQLKEGLLVALLERERTGQGALVEVSLWDSALASLANVASNVLMAGWKPERSGTEHPNLFPYGTLINSEVLVAVGTDRQFEGLCRVLERPDLAERYRANPQRVEAREELRPQLQAAAARFTTEQLLTGLEREKVPAGKLQNAQEALESPAARALLLEHEGIRSLRTTVFNPRKPLRPPPRLGEHTEEVLGGLVR